MEQLNIPSNIIISKQAVSYLEKWLFRAKTEFTRVKKSLPLPVELGLFLSNIPSDLNILQPYENTEIYYIPQTKLNITVKCKILKNNQIKIIKIFNEHQDIDADKQIELHKCNMTKAIKEVFDFFNLEYEQNTKIKKLSVEDKLIEYFANL